MALTLWLLGYPDQALQSSHEALTIAQEWLTLRVWPSPCMRLPWLHHSRRERHLTQRAGRGGGRPRDRAGVGALVGVGHYPGGRVLVEQGQGEAGMAQMRQGCHRL